MTYEAREGSVQDAAPIELYRFACGAQEWFYTSSEQDLSIDSNVYVSAPITRGKLERTPERVRNNLQVTVPRNLPAADIFRIWPRTDVVAVTVSRYHRDDAETVVLWMGRVLGVGWSNSSAQLQCEPASTSARRTGLRRLYQKNCPYALFDHACGLDKETFRHTTTVTSTSGLEIVVATVGALPYAGGWVEWEVTPGNLERRPIKSVFLTNTFTLVFPFQNIPDGAAISIFPGDDHTIGTCSAVFNNSDNFGGMPYIPFKNPFDGNPVY